MTRAGAHPMDPRGLIREAYRIEGIGPEDCRSIFFDWAMGLAAGTDPAGAAAELRAHHAGEPEDHPMTRLLDEAVASGGMMPTRRGGRQRGRPDG